MAAASDYINALDAQSHYEAHSDVLEKLLVIHNFVGDTVEEFYEYVKSSKAYQHHMSTDEFKETWSAAKTQLEEDTPSNVESKSAKR